MVIANQQIFITIVMMTIYLSIFQNIAKIFDVYIVFILLLNI